MTGWPMIIELVWTSRGWDTLLNNRWTNPGFLPTSNALDWVWQRINKRNGTVYVFKNDNRIILATSGEPGRGSNYALLFSGDAREVVQQLRPYLLMMEGM